MNSHPSLISNKQSIALIESLPSNFAQEVLDLEGSLDYSCELRKVKCLLALYSWAIEYYESQGDSRYLSYKERLHLLLSREDVLYLLEHPDSGPISYESSYLKQKLEAQQRTLSKSLNKASCLKMVRCAEQTFQLHKTESSKSVKKLKENLKSQCNLLELRVKERSMRQRSADLDTETGSSWSGIDQASFDTFEEKIEEVMQWFHEEKEHTRRKIEEKYEEQIEEISEIGDFTYLDAVISQMKKKMNEEIYQNVQEIEDLKKKKISRLRQEFYTS